MEKNCPHAAQHAFVNLLCHLVRHFVVAHMSPPDNHIGIIEQFVGYAAVRHKGLIFVILSHGTHNYLITAQKICNLAVYAVRINFLDFFIGLLMHKFIKNCYSYHNRYLVRIFQQ